MKYANMIRYILPPLVALAIALPNLPGEERVYEAQPPESGNLLEFFAPQEFNGEVDSGWVFYDVALLQESLRISLRKDEQKYWVYFIPASNPRRLTADCQRKYCVHVPTYPQNDATFVQVARRMSEILAANLDAGHSLFTERTRPTNLPAPWYEIGFLLVVGTLALLTWRGIRATIEGREWSAGLLIALFGTSLWFRLTSVVHGPLHNNHHGAEELDYWLVPPESLFPSYYGRGFQAVSDLIFSLLPRTYNSFMLVAAVVGALSCVMAALVTRELTASRRLGWFAGFALALHPIANRVAASESTFNFAVLFALLSLWGLLRYRKGASDIHLLLGHAALFLAVVCHILTLSFVLLPLLVLLIPARPTRSSSRLLQQLIALAASALLALPHALYEWQADLVRSSAVSDPGKLFEVISGYGNLLLDPVETPWLLLLLALPTLLLLKRREWRLFILLASLLIGTIPFYLVHVSFSDLVRYQVFPATISVILAGVGVELLLDLVPSKRLKVVATVSLVALLALNCAILSPATNRHDAGSQEYETLRRWADDMPQSGMLILPRELDAHVRFHSYFPALILQDRGLAYTVVTIPEFERMFAQGGWPDEPVLYYEGLQLLWTVATDDPRNPELHGQIGPIIDDTVRIKQYADRSATKSEQIIVPTISRDFATEFTELPANPTITLYQLRP